MNTQLTESEQRVMNILNYKDVSNDIWITAQDLIYKIKMDSSELEFALYNLQVKRMIRVSVDEVGNIKLTTESKVENKIANRISSALGGMNEAMEEAVEEENYEEAAKLRDWSLMAKNPAMQDEFIKSLLDDIEGTE